MGTMPRLAIATANAMVDALTARLANGSIRFYSGMRPATCDTAPSGDNVHLGTVTLSATPFAAAANGQASANLPITGTAIAAGRPTWFRAFTSAGLPVYDGEVGYFTGNDINLNVEEFANGGAISATSLTIRQRTQ